MADPTQPGTELVTYDDEIGIGRLNRTPIIERINEHQLILMQKTIAVGEGDQVITRAELGHFLELCALYGLDPFAREAWIAKSKSGKLLIMVGRAGLRKIVNRNGLKMRSAVVYAKDEYMVEYIDSPDDAKEGEWAAHGSAPFHRVTHKQRGLGEQRGAVIGAWARVTDRKTNVEGGWFDGPLSEYMPANLTSYSPWSKQVSAMMKGAVERQAASEATPLGGLLMEGEDESANATRTVAAGQGDGSMPEWTIDTAQRVKAEAIIERAKALGHHGLSDEATIRMRLNGQTFSWIEEWIARETAVLDGFRGQGEAITDADVIEPDAPAEEFTLSFGGETFAFNDSDDPYAMIAAALTEGPDAMEATARDLRAGAESLSEEFPDEAQRHLDMAVALHAEAQERA